jgi:nucleoside-diphosphate-sugar epimerase
MASKIVVTGGLGHIGSYIVPLLCGSYETSSIYVLDDLSSERYCSIPGLLGMRRNVNLEICSILNLSDTAKEAIRSADVVIHLAAATNATASMDDKEFYMRTNVYGTTEILKHVREAKVIYPSTTSVYGKASLIVDESPEHLDPQSPYAESKLFGEGLVTAHSPTNTVLRLGTIFGISKGMRFHTAINKLCLQAFLREPLSVWEDNLDKVRPYLGLWDCWKAVVLALDIPGGIYNVLSENKSLNYLLSCIRMHAREVKINYVSTPLLNQYSYSVSYEKIRQLGFAPDDKVEAGVRHTLNHLKFGLL